MTLQHHHTEATWLEDTLLTERPRIMRLCTSWTGNPHTAEDLAQETLIEAWRNVVTLRNRDAVGAWLNGIARNIYLRWLRRQSREDVQQPLMTMADDDGGDPLQQLAADYDLEVELERAELVVLLDRALALLPAETRTALVQKYVENSPHAEIAARLGLSEGAVAMRLQRGKLALQRVLATTLRNEATAYGLVRTTPDDWQETRLWCPLCGQRKLLGLPPDVEQGFALFCPVCGEQPSGMVYSFAAHRVFAGVKGYKAGYTRIATWGHDYYRPALLSGMLVCEQCGRPARLQHGAPPSAPLYHQSMRAVHVACATCVASAYASLNGLTLDLPEVQQFWRQHPRMRILPERQIEHEGKAVLLLRCESLGEYATLDVLAAEDTYELLLIHHATGR